MASAPAKVHNLEAQYPPPDYPLGDLGQAKYEQFCSELAEAGLLTSLAREEVQKLAVAVDQIARAYALDKPATKVSMESQSSALRALRKIMGQEGEVTDGMPSGDNVFANFGFAKRAKDARHSGSE